MRKDYSREITSTLPSGMQEQKRCVSEIHSKTIAAKQGV
jgi:hypothetical protein